MRYLIIPPQNSDEYLHPFYTFVFEHENHFIDGMKVFDLHTEHYTTNGVDWEEIQKDHL